MQNKYKVILSVSTVLAFSANISYAAPSSPAVGSSVTITKTAVGKATVVSSNGSSQNIAVPTGFSLPNAQKNIKVGQSATIVKTAEGKASVTNFQGQSPNNTSTPGSVSVNVNGETKATISTGNASGAVNVNGGKTSGTMSGQIKRTDGSTYSGNGSYSMKGTTFSVTHSGKGTNKSAQTVYSGNTGASVKVGVTGVSGTVSYSGTSNNYVTTSKSFNLSN